MPNRLTSYQIRILISGVFGQKDLKNWNQSLVNKWSEKHERSGFSMQQVIEMAEEAVSYWEDGGSVMEEVQELSKSLHHAVPIYSKK